MSYICKLTAKTVGVKIMIIFILTLSDKKHIKFYLNILY